MGTDIHAHIQYRNGGDAWYYFAEVELDRSYLIFGEMAGVRNPSETSIPARGLPDAAGEVLGEHYDSCQVCIVYSESWLTTEEFAGVLDRCRQRLEPGVVLPPSYDATLAAMQAFHAARILFWFSG